MPAMPESKLTTMILCFGMLVVGGVIIARWDSTPAAVGYINLASDQGAALGSDEPVVLIPRRQTVSSAGTPQGQVVSFDVHNRGKTPVIVQQIRSTCGCTLAEPLANVAVSPGAKLPIKVQVTPPTFGEREVAVIVSVEMSGDVREIVHSLQLVGAPLAEERTIDLITHLDLVSYDHSQVEREFQIRTIERTGEPWLRRLQTDRRDMHCRIVESIAQELPSGNVSRVYHCLLTLNLPLEQTSEREQRTEQGMGAIQGKIMLEFERPPVDPVRPIAVAVSLKSKVTSRPSVLFVPKSAEFPWRQSLTLLSASGLLEDANDELVIGQVPPSVQVNRHEKSTRFEVMVEARTTHGAELKSHEIEIVDARGNPVVTIPVLFE